MSQASQIRLFTWLHLSDLHLAENDRSKWDDLFQETYSAINLLHQKTGPWHAIFFSGDLVFGGKKGEFDEFSLWYQDFLNQLDSSVAALPLVVVPGNHDVHRRVFDPADHYDATTQLFFGAFGLHGIDWERYMVDFCNNTTHEVRVMASDIFKNYAVWWQNSNETATSRSRMTSGVVPGDGTFTITGDGVTLGLVCMNTSVLDSIGSKQAEVVFGQKPPDQRLYWHHDQVVAAADGDLDGWARQFDVAFLMTHHDPTFLRQSANATSCHVRGNGRFTLHLCGHTHKGRLLGDNADPNLTRWIAESLRGYANAITNSTGATVSNWSSRWLGFAVGQIEIHVNGPNRDIFLRRWSQNALSVEENPPGKDRHISQFVSATPASASGCYSTYLGNGSILSFESFTKSWEDATIRSLAGHILGGMP